MTKQNKKKQNKQNKTEQNKTKQNKTTKTKQNKNKTKQNYFKVYTVPHAFAISPRIKENLLINYRISLLFDIIMLPRTNHLSQILFPLWN